MIIFLKGYLFLEVKEASKMLVFFIYCFQYHFAKLLAFYLKCLLFNQSYNYHLINFDYPFYDLKHFFIFIQNDSDLMNFIFSSAFYRFLKNNLLL